MEMTKQEKTKNVVANIRKSLAKFDDVSMEVATDEWILSLAEFWLNDPYMPIGNYDTWVWCNYKNHENAN